MNKENIINEIKKETEALGFASLNTPQEVDKYIEKDNLKILLVNSMCGCTGSKIRAVIANMLNRRQNDNLDMAYVFSGVNDDATLQLFHYTKPYPPSSPAFTIFKGTKMLLFIERHQIQSQGMEDLIENITLALKDAESNN